jgi:hypothetical protein
MKRLAVAVVALLAACTPPSPVARPGAATSPGTAAPPGVVTSPGGLSAQVAPQPIVLPEPSDPPVAPRPNIAPFRNVDISIPSWPRASTQCVSGRIHLGAAGQYVPPSPDYTVVNVMAVLQVDLDRDGTNEYAVHLMCGEGPESGGRMLVGYRRSGSGFTLIGRIVGTQDSVKIMEIMRRRNDAVEVLVVAEYSDDGSIALSQWRTYALRDNRFRQIAGPTAFPSNPPYVRFTVQAGQIVMRTVGSVRTGSLKVTILNSGPAAAPSMLLSLAVPPAYRATGSGWAGCVAGAPQAISCPLPSLAAGGRLEATYDLLGPLDPPPSGDYMVSVQVTTLEVFDRSTASTAPLTLLFP